MRLLTHYKLRVLACCAVLISYCAPALSAPQTPLTTPPIPTFAANINAGKIAAIADGDMLAQSYDTKQLAPISAGFRDTLSVLYINNGKVLRKHRPLSNSVMAPPEILTLTNDGSLAFVIETRGQGGSQSRSLNTLPAGQRLFAVDLATDADLNLLDTITTLPFPEAVDVRQTSTTQVAVIANSDHGSYLDIIDFTQKTFKHRQRFALKKYMPALTGDQRLIASNVHWHPTADVLAINFNHRNQIAFFKLSSQNDTLALQRWGDPVAVGNDPFVGRFTPNGRHYISANWGRNFQATTLSNRLPTTPSSLSVVQLAPFTPTQKSPHHRVVDSALSDISSEGIAISPDGTKLATINMRGTALLPSAPDFTPDASVSLFSLNPTTGKLKKRQDYPFAGLLPEGGSFDLSGEHLLVSVFEYANSTTAEGGVEVFRVIDSETPHLERLGRLPFPHGVHHVEVAP